MNMLERNKKNVVAFYDLMFNQSRPREAIAVFRELLDLVPLALAER